jgi:hypothetical protein
MSELLDVALQAHGSNAGVKPKFRGTNDESNVRRVVHGVGRPEASRGMNMSRYISKSISLLTLSLVICCGLYLLSPRVIGQPRFPFQANGSMLTGPDSNIVRSPQITQQFTKDEYFQSRPSAASYEASVSTSSSAAASNSFLHRQNRDFGEAETPLLQRPVQRVCHFYDC